MSNRRLSPESRKENRNTIKKSLSTVQGVSTLKIVLMYSVLGIILNWVLPTLIHGVKPQIPKDKADLWGTTIAMVITAVLLVVALLKNIITLQFVKMTVLLEYINLCVFSNQKNVY